MVYSDKFIAVVKYNGQILREHDSVVTLPFGSEYSILLKNLNSVKALVKISIDGKDVLDGNEIIVSPNSETTLEGFLKGYRATNKFKFIQKTKEIVNHRGDRVDDGIIRVEFRFEKKKEYRLIQEYRLWTCPTCGCNPCTCWPFVTRTFYGSSINNVYYSSNLGSTSESLDQGASSKSTGQAIGASQTFTASAGDELRCAKRDITPTPNVDEGITVKGGDTNQLFMFGSIGELEPTSQVIIIKLRGTKENGTVIEQPVFTKKKIQCPTCGRHQKSHLKFCGNCGTALT